MHRVLSQGPRVDEVQRTQMTSWSVLGHQKMVVTRIQVERSDEEWL